jgi:hypothetical protein
MEWGFVLHPLRVESYSLYLEFFYMGDISPLPQVFIYLFPHLFMSMDIYFELWIITRYYFTYVVQIGLALSAGNFSVAFCPFDMSCENTEILFLFC